jgi:hypothetical protein
VQSGQILLLLSIIAELSPLPLLKFWLLLSFDFWANGNLFGWHNGEYSQRTGWSRGLSGEREPTPAADLGSSHRFNLWVSRWANRVATIAHAQLYSWWQWGKKCSRSSSDHLQGLRSHSFHVVGQLHCHLPRRLRGVVDWVRQTPHSSLEKWARIYLYDRYMLMISFLALRIPLLWRV